MSTASPKSEVLGQVVPSPSMEVRRQAAKNYGGIDPYDYPASAFAWFVDDWSKFYSRDMPAEADVWGKVKLDLGEHRREDFCRLLFSARLAALSQSIVSYLFTSLHRPLLCGLLNAHVATMGSVYHVVDRGEIELHHATPSEEIDL